MKKIFEIEEIIKKEEYECYGIRVDDNIIYKVGDTCQNSHQWWQDDPGEESGIEYVPEMQAWDGGELPGTCALEVSETDVEEILKNATMYYGDHITLIGSNSYEVGNDDGEVIMEEAKVLKIIK